MMEIVVQLLAFYFCIIYFKYYSLLIAIWSIVSLCLLFYELNTLFKLWRKVTAQEINEKEMEMKKIVIYTIAKKQVGEFVLGFIYIISVTSWLGLNNFSSENFIYLVPPMLATLWKTKRLHLLFEKELGDKQDSTEILGFTLLVELMNLECISLLLIGFYHTVFTLCYMSYYAYLYILSKLDENSSLTNQKESSEFLDIKSLILHPIFFSLIVIKHKNSSSRNAGMSLTVSKMNKNFLTLALKIRSIWPWGSRALKRKIKKINNSLNKYSIIQLEGEEEKGSYRVNWIHKMGLEGTAMQYYLSG